MKSVLFLLIITAISFAANAQQADSTSIKLNKYKIWYDQGLINEEEYEDLKEKELNISNTPVEKIKLKHTSDYYRGKAKGQLVSGSLFAAAGTGFVIWSFRYQRNKIDTMFPVTLDKQDELDTKKAINKFIKVSAFFSYATSVFMFSRCVVNFSRSKSPKHSLQGFLSPSGVYLSLTF